MEITSISKDEQIRQEFARAFGWWKNTNRYGTYRENEQNEPRIPTWEEVFVEVGRLLNRSQTLIDTYAINALERRMNDLEQLINSKKD